MHVNYPSRILPVGAGTAVIATGQTIDSLALGQIGVFDADTNLSVDAADVAARRVKNFYIAVGTDSTGDGAVDDVRKSTGQHIPVGFDSIQAYNLRCYSPGRDQVIRIQVSERTPECDREWGLKFEVRGNTSNYRQHGYNQVSASYVVRTPCCDPGQTADQRELMHEFYQVIKADYDNGLTPFNPILYDEAAPGVDIGDFATWFAGAAATDYLGLQITVETQGLETWCDIPAKYYRLRGFRVHTTALGSFFCSDGSDYADLQGSIVDAFTLLYPEGAGYDLKHHEYHSDGYTDNPSGIRIGNDLHMLPIGQRYLVDESANYHVIDLTYQMKTVEGVQGMNRLMTTKVAFATGDEAAFAAFVGILDALLVNAGHGPNANDAAICTNVGPQQQTSALAHETDGIDVM